MEIRTLLKRGSDHLVNCEDDHFLFQSEELTIGAIFDGCSTGTKSHFASTLYSKILNNSINLSRFKIVDNIDDISFKIFESFFNQLKELKNYLNLDELELLSTFIIVIIYKDETEILVSGDGCILVDDQEFKIESEGNAPDYLAYHLNDGVANAFNSIEQYRFDGFDDLSICSDGIYSFRKKDEENIEEQTINHFLKDKSLLGSEAMLARKYNIFTKNGFDNYDDLSIIRFIK